MNVELNQVGTSDRIDVNHEQQNFKLGLFVSPRVGTTFRGTVEYTPDGEHWFDLEDMVDISKKEAGNIFFPVVSVRLRLDEVAGGAVELIASQGA